jgi:lysophospholipase L1-like esterase
MVEQVLAAGPPRPTIVIVQECSVYFPGDLPTYQRLYRGWIERLRAAGFRPAIATVVPPARSRGWWQKAKELVKEHVLRRGNRHEQVAAFNDWLRALGTELAIPVLDLELLLRVSAEERHMRPEYDAGDGTHLAPAAYQRLDRVLLEFLDRLEHQGGSG